MRRDFYWKNKKANKSRSIFVSCYQYVFFSSLQIYQSLKWLEWTTEFKMTTTLPSYTSIVNSILKHIFKGILKVNKKRRNWLIKQYFCTRKNNDYDEIATHFVNIKIIQFYYYDLGKPCNTFLFRLEEANNSK